MYKQHSRRTFLEKGLKAGLTLPLLALGLHSCHLKSEEKGNSKKLNILILGGTSFLGPHQIAYAISRGHSISTFTRGKTKPTIHKEIFKNVEQLIGDRNDDLSALKNRKWDAVIDNSGHNAEWTKKSAALLRDNCDLYLYTSSTGVFYPYINSDFKEESAVSLMVPEKTTDYEKMEYDYGVMKAKSELETFKYFGRGRAIIVRPTYMIGPGDRTDRFIHWPIKLSKGGETLVPGKAEDMVQYIDVRDTAEWMIRLIEESKPGVYNAVGPKEAQNIYSFVEEAKDAFDVETSFVKIDDYEFLKAEDIHHIVPWIMPEGKNEGSAKINNQKAKENGLSFRPLVESVKDIYDWWYSDAISQERRDKVALDPKSILIREQAIIAKWKSL